MQQTTMQQKGFTLIELLVVLALIAILAAILIVVVKPAQIFTRGRDAQRQGDLRILSQAVDAYLTEVAINPSNTPWPCSSGVRIRFSTSSPGSAGSPPYTGWPTTTAGISVTGTNSDSPTGTGWVDINFSLAPVVNLPKLPLDPRNGQTGKDATTNSVVFVVCCILIF